MPKSSNGPVSGLLTILLLVGCGPKPSEQIHERTMLAFGTIIDVAAIGNRAQVESAFDALERYFAKLHLDWYAHGEGELGRVNDSLARGLSAELSPELGRLLRHALALRDASAGAFDPTVGDLVKLWGFADLNEPRAQPPDQTLINEWLKNAADRASLRLVGARIRADGPVSLDLSAMAKGAALEGAANLLAEHGIENAIVDAGGDIKVLGHRGARPWRVGIQHPRASRTLASLAMRSGEAVVTSGDYRRFFEHDDRRFHHIVDPRSGRPVSHTIAVTVIAPDAALADAAATALMIAGADGFEAMTQSLGIQTALLISADGNIIMTASMEQRLLSSSRDTGDKRPFRPQL